MTSQVIESSGEPPSTVIETATDTTSTTLADPQHDVLVVQDRGARGPVGPVGPQPDPPYMHTQDVESVEWIVNHNKGRAVAVTVFTVSGAEATAEVAPTSPNQVRVRHASPQRGSALVL